MIMDPPRRQGSFSESVVDTLPRSDTVTPLSPCSGHPLSVSTVGVAFFDIEELVKGGFHSYTIWTESYILRDIRRPHADDAISDTIVQDPNQASRRAIMEHIYDAGVGYNFVVKHIQRHFMDNHQDFEAAASNLEQEATIMQRLRHQHIAQLRGIASSGVESYYRTGGRNFDAYFLILDKISESMESRIKRWKKKQTRRRLSQKLGGWWGNQSSMMSAEERFFCKRLDVAYTIADALAYMHERKIAYRNFGVDKVGFNNRNEVQLIELGDADVLEENKDASNGLKRRPRRLTSYSAPETLDGFRLTSKADSYSYSKLFSEILTLILVGPNASPRDTQAYVYEFQKVARRLPRETLDLLENGASTNPIKRPTLRDYCETIDLAKAVTTNGPKRSTSLPALRSNVTTRTVTMIGSVQ
jgi:serine/threonine protein kinase